MKNLKLILLAIVLLIFGCDSLGELQENSEVLSGKYYDSMAWQEFLNANFDDAEELFLAPLSGENRTYDYLSYLGLSWVSIYKSNIENENSERNSLRSSIIVDIDSAYSSIRGNRLNQVSWDDLVQKMEEAPSYYAACDTVDRHLTSDTSYVIEEIYWSNFLAASSFFSSYKGSFYSNEYYQTNDDLLLDSIAIAYNDLITKTDMLLCVDPEYLFPYDPYNDKIDVNDIYFMRANAYIRLGNLEKAEASKNMIVEGLENCTSSMTIFECLSTYIE